MVELIVICEGMTEEGFVRDVLAPHLGLHHVNCKAIVVETSRARKKMTGGGNKWSLWKDEASRWLADTRTQLRVTTFLDLYKIPRDIPGKPPAPTLPVYERVHTIESAMRSSISDPRFLPFIMVHEFETILFADLDRLREAFPDDASAVLSIQNDLKDGNKPCIEWINDGQHTHPAARIIKHLPAYESRKASAGPVVASKVGLPAIRRTCPHFNDWFCLLEQLDAHALHQVRWPVVASFPGPASADGILTES